MKRIERLYRLRLIYGLHLALYGMILVLGVLAVNPVNWHNAALILTLWLPILLAHTAAQSLYELRERCAVYVPVPVERLKRFNTPVDLYDEHGRPISNSDKMDYQSR